MIFSKIGDLNSKQFLPVVFSNLDVPNKTKILNPAAGKKSLPICTVHIIANMYCANMYCAHPNPNPKTYRYQQFVGLVVDPGLAGSLESLQIHSLWKIMDTCNCPVIAGYFVPISVIFRCIFSFQYFFHFFC